jgi:hypothetical protein
MAKSPRQERNERLTKSFSGVMGSSSADFMRLVRHLYSHSAQYAAKCDGNLSPYTLAAIPMLFSAVRCFAIEYENYFSENVDALEKLKTGSDFAAILDIYKIQGSLLHEASLLWEIRNEIIHPVHRPTGTKDNWPDSLREIKDMGLLQSSGSPDHDYIMMAQLESHRLFGYACGVIREVVRAIAISCSEKAPHFLDFMGGYDFGPLYVPRS